MPISMAGEQDVRRLPARRRRMSLGSRRIGIHTSAEGGVAQAAERAWRLGCSAFQIFSSNPRQWKATAPSAEQCQELRRLRNQYSLAPLVIHANYLIKLGSANPVVRELSEAAFRGELERAQALGAEYLVLHPGSFRGSRREESLQRMAASVARVADGFKLESGELTILIENTAGSEFSLGGSFEQVAEVLERLRGIVPIAACMDTCHAHVAGYDIVSEDGYRRTMESLEQSVGPARVAVWHINDAKAARGSRLDRHEQIGKGTIGRMALRRLLRDPRVAQAAFIAETPIDRPGDDARNVRAMWKMVAET